MVTGSAPAMTRRAGKEPTEDIQANRHDEFAARMLRFRDASASIRSGVAAGVPAGIGSAAPVRPPTPGRSRKCKIRTLEYAPDLPEPEAALVNERILIVEDESAIREMVASALVAGAFSPAMAGDAAEADSAIRAAPPHLILLDWMLPGAGGLEFARRLRRGCATRDIPIIMLTARCEEQERLQAFEAGIDDYVAKPFSLLELLARIRAVLRRSVRIGEDGLLEAEGLCLDPASHRVSSAGRPVKMGPTEFRMLRFFMRNQERVFTRSQLLDRVWGSDIHMEERSVDVHIRRLRKAPSPYGHERLVQTVHGTGYRFSREP